METQKYKVRVNSFCELGETTYQGGDVIDLTEKEAAARSHLVDPVKEPKSKDNDK
jgi:hypothetical protein